MTNLNKILADLYALDPGLQKHESELKAILDQLLASRPDMAIDEHFVLSLRQKLQTRAQALQIKAEEKLSFNLIPLTMFKKLLYGLGGAAVMAVLLLSLITVYSPKGTSINSPKSSLTKDQIAFQSGVTKAEKEAFGALKTNTNSKVLGGGGGLGSSAGTEAVASPAPVAPDSVKYKYIYKGEPLPALAQQMSVYKRIRKSVNDETLLNYLKNLQFNLLNLTDFQSLNLKQLSLVEDKDFGYNIDLNFEDSSINIYENWGHWKNPLDDCQGNTECVKQNQLKKEDVPGDEELIAIANNFLKVHHINLDNYGAPKIIHDWDKNWDNLPVEERMVPEAISVIYPLILDGQEIKDEMGNPNGLGVPVNIRHKIVSGLWNLRAENYLNSLYDLVTDNDKILKQAEKGGMTWQPEIAAGELEIEIGTPKLIYTRTWMPDPQNPVYGPGQELAVPAYIFPVLNKPNTYFFDNITVPLVENLWPTPLPGVQP